ncbi:MAG: hypothetical protein KJ600_01295 [Nanoarchaeota archaeon]|nr:hypothetical protein [Nanoarchaeota archaeon]MBU1103178.1 hypothetical protein [Nanoarchaeota archaeon]
MQKKALAWTTALILVFALIFVVILVFGFITSPIPKLSPPAQQTHAECIDNRCIAVNSSGPNKCFPVGSFCGCLDTDNDFGDVQGINFFSAGMSRNLTTSLSDSCSSSGKLTEYYCEENAVKSIQAICENLGNYTCEENACLSTGF